MRRLAPGDLSPRDVAVLRDLARVRMLTGRQLERLNFYELRNANARGSARRRSLGRLVEVGLVTTLPRRVGGVRAGSAGLIYMLDARGQRERPLWDDQPQKPQGKVRRPWATGWLFVRHNLDVAELYVRLREVERRGQLRLEHFDAEPAAWHRDDLGVLKPDAYVVLEVDGWQRFWWIEVDRATESVPTVRRKLEQYLQRYDAGSAGPSGVLPRVLVTAPDEQRRAQLAQVIGQLAAGEYLTVTRFECAPEIIQGEPPRPPP